jgi:hypothetical protein
LQTFSSINLQNLDGFSSMDNSLSKKYGRTTGIINDGVSIYLSKGVSVFLSAIVDMDWFMQKTTDMTLIE